MISVALMIGLRYTGQQKQISGETRLKLNIHDIQGSIVKDNDVYRLKDNTALKNLVLSSTTLWPGQSTRGHRHDGQEEVYYFVAGAGQMELNDQLINVAAGDIVLIEDNVFHKVYNLSDHEPLYFVCVFDGRRSH